MMWISRRIGLVCLALLTFAACGSGGDSNGGSSGNDSDVQVSEDVRVLDQRARDTLVDFELDRESGAGELRFDAGDPAVAAIQPGMILAAEPVPGVAPYGFLQRVEARREVDGQIVFETRQATLEEAFEEADIEYTVELRPEDVVSTAALYQGIKVQALTQEVGHGESYDFVVDFDRVLIDLDGDHDTTNDQLRIDGKFAFSAGVEAKIKIGLENLVSPALEHLRFVAYMREAADVTLSGTLGLEFEKEFKVAGYHFGAITVPVGPVPVVFTITLDLHVGASGSIEARLVAQAEQSLELNVGAEYTKKDGWKNISSFDSNFDFPGPEITAAASAQAFAKPRLDVSVYGVAGPYIYSSAFVEADAEYKRDPFWRLDAGVYLGVGFMAELPVIGNVVDWSHEFEIFRKTLQSSPNSAPTLEIVSPENGARLEDGALLNIRIRAHDREDATLPVVLTLGGQEIDSGTIEGDDVLVFRTDPLCPGRHDFEVSVTDSKGATTTAKLHVVVDNRVPEVTLRADLLEEQEFYAGTYLQASASVRDQGCAETPSADPDLIEWYVNGALVGESDTLRFLVPPYLGDGDEIVVEARYDDGFDVGVSESVALPVQTLPPGTTLPLLVEILSPVSGGVKWMYQPIHLEARAMDPMTGVSIGPEHMQWETRYSGNWISLPPGSTSYYIEDIFGESVFGGHTVRLTVRHGGQEVSKTVSFRYQPHN